MIFKKKKKKKEGTQVSTHGASVCLLGVCVRRKAVWDASGSVFMCDRRWGTYRARFSVCSRGYQETHRHARSDTEARTEIKKGGNN